VSNKYYLTLGPTGKTINIPIEMKWDFGGREDSIELYEEDVIQEIIGEPNDFEVLRFEHESYEGGNPPRLKSEIYYRFNFFIGNPATVSATTNANTQLWTNSYLQTFSSTEVYYNNKPFSKSFFKIDFYDTPNGTTQTNYFTLIIPTQQGRTQDALISPALPIQKIKKPEFFLDFVGDKEGFFIYWLRSRDFINLTTFYMSAKFFDARIGVFVPMVTVCQAELPIKFNFNNPDYLYYRVELDYNKKTYKVFNNLGRVGINRVPINWFQYVNP